ncbi:MAG TPA: glutamine-hydrolyzing carbamoyl-phosphate synthase small subunit [Anaerolineae bacterium]|nr:glutamine-hydrolyzing carbamoyl-phosphate synthase small subunit [Anaerolineae bacterium]
MAEALLVLEDGTQWRGVALGAQGTRAAEVVFNTSLTGYQEVLTDPSYYAQIVVMTAAHIGNTGINRADPESARIWLAGFAVREASRIPSNWRAEESLDAYLRAQNVVGISELDTRGLVRHLRTRGVMRGALSSQILDADALLQIARDAPDMNGADLVRHVTCDEPYHWDEAVEEKWYSYATDDGRRLPADDAAKRRRQRISGYGPWSSSSGRFHVVAYDYGIKYNILRLLTARGCRVTIVPAQTSADQVLTLEPDGIFLSNGPGDPAAVTYAIESVRDLLGVKPIFGICLGHQILALALGGDTYKLKFGHRGMNQPVKNLVTGQVEITTHNHGFAVRAASLPKHVEITHLNLNDDCVEGLRVPSLDVLAAQFHPESAGGTHDALGLFDEFVSLMANRVSHIANRASQP